MPWQCDIFPEMNNSFLHILANVTISQIFYVEGTPSFLPFFFLEAIANVDS